MALTQVNGGMLDSVAQQVGFRNRIINGAMMIDQRNAGASVTPNNSYTLDRWYCATSQTGKYTVQQNAGAVTTPAGFTKYLGVTSSSAYSVGAGDVFAVVQHIEGLNVADLAWGTASASAVTLSFKVYSSLTGTFGGAITNSAYNRSYPFSYTISSANTWTTVSITIPGDTTGAWLTDNGIGIRVRFGLGCGSTYSGTAGTWAATDYWSATGATSVVGTNAATFYITGVQLEKGSTATSFDYRPYGTELALCQRYAEKSYSQGTALGANTAAGCVLCADGGAFGAKQGFRFQATKRTAPTITGYTETGTSGSWNYPGSSGAVTFGDVSDAGVRYISVTGSGSNPVDGQFFASAEL